MKYLVIIVITLMVNCLPQPFSKNTAKADNIQLLYVYCFAMYNAWTEVTTVTDNKDGTVRILVEGVNPCGGRKLVSDVLLKKCIQGQVFRSAQNDCKGTGTSTDYYGAQKFQFCPTNDGSCENSVEADINKSPAANSCDKDSTGGIKWKLILPPSNIKQIYISNFINRDEIPDDVYWINFSFASETVAYVTFLSNVKNTFTRSKNSYQYVICYNSTRV